MTTDTRIVLILLAVTAGVIGIMLVARSSDTPALESSPPDSAARDSVPTTTAPAADADSVYNPVRAGEETPRGFRQLLPRDAILPIYDPQFISASQADWHDKSLVIGLAIDGDARAYPVSFLNRREIVNDHVGKTPVLVTW